MILRSTARRLGLATAIALVAVGMAPAAANASAPVTSSSSTASCPTTPLLDYDVVPATDMTTTKRGFNGAIIERANGSLLLVADEFEGVEDNDPGVINGRISTDDGATWGAPYLIQDNIGDRTVAAQGIVRLGATKLGLAFAVVDDNAVISIWFKTSDDDGLTWNTEYQVTASGGHYAAGNDRLVELSNGRLILPLAGTSPVQNESGAFAIYSDDGGVTWDESAFVEPLSDFPAEPVVVELSDTTVMMLIRGTGGTIERSYSTDFGETWSATDSTGVQSPYAPSIVKRIDGKLVLIWNNSPTESRRPLTIATSEDEGDTWDIVQNLTPSASGLYAYPSLLHHDGKLYVTFYTLTSYPSEYTLPLRLQVWDDCLVVDDTPSASSLVVKSPTKVKAGKVAKFDVKVKSHPRAKGTVVVRKGGQILSVTSLDNLGSKALKNRKATVRVDTGSLAVGQHQLTVVYLGTDQVASSQSTVDLKVKAP